MAGLTRRGIDDHETGAVVPTQLICGPEPAFEVRARWPSPTQVAASASPPGSTVTSRPTSSPPISPSTSRTRCGKTLCCIAARVAWFSFQGRRARCRNLPSRHRELLCCRCESDRSADLGGSPVLDDTYPAWPLLQRLGVGRPMAELIYCVDDVKEASSLLTGGLATSPGPQCDPHCQLAARFHPGT